MRMVSVCPVLPLGVYLPCVLLIGVLAVITVALAVARLLNEAWALAFTARGRVARGVFILIVSVVGHMSSPNVVARPSGLL